AGATEIAAALMGEGLLNEYQARRLLDGDTDGLVLGDYRVLGCLGEGGSGTVYRAEHGRLKRLAAVKVLAGERRRHSPLLALVQSEVQALEAVRHPALVRPFHAGEEVAGSRSRVLRFLVMEHVQGRDLERLVREDGPLPVATACGYVG